MSTAALRYAKALFELAQTHKQLPALTSPVSALAAALADATIAAALTNPRLEPSQRSKLATAMARAVAAPALLANTLNLLASNNRLALLPDVLQAFQSLADAAAGLARVQLQTATAFTPEQLTTLKSLIKAQLKATSVEVEQSLQPGLIGGFRALYGGQVWDASVSGQLARLKTRLQMAATR
ncbi:MAG: ATP synthase F1 subunit delta [Proteobacteria bacterium]|nr:ATP synthase F1 subunit delta [Pseudomonadota bacterium]